jgi:hypothetical protein
VNGGGLEGHRIGGHTRISDGFELFHQLGGHLGLHLGVAGFAGDVDRLVPGLC